MSTAREKKLELSSFSMCPMLNVSQCDTTEQQMPFVVNVYNSLSREVSKFIRIPVVVGPFVYQIIGSEGMNIHVLYIQ